MKQAKSRLFAILRTCVLVPLLSPLIAVAQDNPLEATTPATPGGAGNPLTRIVVPDYIKPGARLIYHAISGSEVRRPNQEPTSSTGAGFTRYDVAAVSGDMVLLNSLNYVTYGLNGQTGVAGGAGIVVRSSDPFANTGGSLWVSKDVLAAMQTDASMNVAHEKWPINGRTYDAVVLTKIQRDQAHRLVYDKDKALLLAMQLATGNPRQLGDPTGFNRENSSSTLFQTYRVLDLPWFKADAPAWVKTVKRLNYQGQQKLHGDVGPSVTMAINRVVEFSERGPNWAILKATTQFQGSQPTTSQSVVGPATIGGYWINPKTLREMKQGVLDEDPTLKNSLTYQIQQGHMGQLGVLVETNTDRSYQIVCGYNLDDGMLVYSMLQDKSLNTVIEFTLVGKE